jgi:hypothetical protein
MSVFSRSLLVSLALVGFFSAASATSTASAANGCIEATVMTDKGTVSTGDYLCACRLGEDGYTSNAYGKGGLGVVIETCYIF